MNWELTWSYAIGVVVGWGLKTLLDWRSDTNGNTRQD